MRRDETRLLCRRLRVGAESGQNIRFGEEDILIYEVNVRIFLASRSQGVRIMIRRLATMPNSEIDSVDFLFGHKRSNG